MILICLGNISEMLNGQEEINYSYSPQVDEEILCCS